MHKEQRLTQDIRKEKGDRHERRERHGLQLPFELGVRFPALGDIPILALIKIAH